MKFEGTSSYIATEDLKVAVNAAITLERPIIVKGEPGTGKTMLAHEVAQSLGAEIITWHIKSTTKAQQGLYEYDAVTRLRDSQLGNDKVNKVNNYIKKGVLWEAFINKKKPVLLIDEIDKYQVSVLIKNSIATFAPYVCSLNYINSIPNKVIESLENGIPFITNTEGELKKLIENFDNGIFLDKNMKNFYKIEKLIEEKEYRKKLRLNSIYSYQELFDFDNTYQEIIINLKEI